MGGVRGLVLAFLVLAVTAAAAATGEGPRDLLRRGQELFRQGKLEEAQTFLEAAVARYPDFHPLWTLYGFALEETKDPEDAVAAFRKARENGRNLAPVVARIIDWKIRDLDAKAATGGAERSERREAEMKKRARTLFLRALRDKGDGRLEAALEGYVDCLELDSSYLVNDYGLIKEGLAFYGAKEGQDPKFLFYHSVYQHLAGNPEEARRLLNRFLKEFPASPLAGRARTRLADLEGALARIAAAAVAPPPATATRTRPLATRPASGTMVAAAPLPASDGTNPDAGPVLQPPEPTVAEQMASAEASEVLAQAREMKDQGKPAEAIKLYAAAMRKQADPQSLLELGDLYLEEDPKGNAGVAVTTFQKVMSRFPNSPQAGLARQRMLSLQTSAEERAKEIEEHFQKVGTTHLDQPED